MNNQGVCNVLMVRGEVGEVSVVWIANVSHLFW